MNVSFDAVAHSDSTEQQVRSHEQPQDGDPFTVAGVNIFADLLSDTERRQLVALGWSIEPTPQGCALRKFVSGYSAKMYLVCARRTQSGFEASGQLLLHGALCSKTETIQLQSGRIFEPLRALLEKTEALTVFDEDSEEF